MQQLIQSGAIVDLILVFVVVEVVVLLLYWHRTGGGLRPLALILNVGAGTCLMLALRAALTGADSNWIALWLVASLIFHMADLAQRWNRVGA